MEPFLPPGALATAQKCHRQQIDHSEVEVIFQLTTGAAIVENNLLHYILNFSNDVRVIELSIRYFPLKKIKVLVGEEFHYTCDKTDKNAARTYL